MKSSGHVILLGVLMLAETVNCARGKQEIINQIIQYMIIWCYSHATG